MKTRILDGLQILLAILITGSMTVYAAPVPQIENKPVSEPQSVAQIENVQEPVPDVPKPASKPETAKKEVSDPNGCEPEQYWAKEAPYECIPKPKTTNESQSVGVAATTSQPASAPSGSCEDWMAQAGVPLTYATRTLIINESGCRPDAINPSSGACGIPQALPCSKLPCTLQDPVCQLRWMDSYVKARYSTWDNALSFWHCIGQCSNNYGTITKTATWY